MPSVVSKVTCVTFSFSLKNHFDLRRPPVENVPSLAGLVGTKKGDFLTWPIVRCLCNYWLLFVVRWFLLGHPTLFGYIQTGE